jgi:hypothetical protein
VSWLRPPPSESVSCGSPLPDSELRHLAEAPLLLPPLPLPLHGSR